MLRELTSLQLAEMEVYLRIDANPVSDLERKAEETQRIKHLFESRMKGSRYVDGRNT
jgi:hypothetical protein